jgi:hypothetical protein
MCYFRGCILNLKGNIKYTEIVPMLKPKPGTLIIFITVFIIYSCIDPYIPNLEGYESLLVVDGLITDANSSYRVKLSRTFQNLNSDTIMVSDATIDIKDDTGEKIFLKNKGNGIYLTDSTEFRGIAGRKYVLHIITGDKEEYESDPCLMLPVPEIESIYITRDQRFVNNNTQSEEGVGIYLDSKNGDASQYYRWTYDETWKIRVPNPKKFNYVKTKDPDKPIFTQIADIKEICWKNRHSDEILLGTPFEGKSQKIVRQPILFIATEKSDRLLLQYSILVKQYSISKSEYEFWSNLKRVNETGGDIFARQPYSVASNIHNIKNPLERVLGFFQVSAVTEKRKNIPYKDVALMGLKFYAYPCITYEFDPSFFETLCRCPPKTWDDVYWYLSIVSDYTFIEPKYNLVEDILLKLVFTRPECADCELSGSHTKPKYWDELVW